MDVIIPLKSEAKYWRGKPSELLCLADVPVVSAFTGIADALEDTLRVGDVPYVAITYNGHKERPIYLGESDAWELIRLLREHEGRKASE